MGGLRVLFASSEIFPLAKTGGLADVSAALPKALAGLGVDIRLILPAYPQALNRISRLSRKIVRLGNLLGAGEVRLLSGRTPDTSLPVWLVDCPALFSRDGGLYQDKDGHDWPDNALRFAVFNHAAFLVAMGEADPDWRADVVHANDWHAGLLPLLIASRPAPRPQVVFTIHNMAFQGVFPFETAARLGLPRPEDAQRMEFFGNISFLKTGIAYSDRLTTVSPTYAQEILTPEYGCGLEGLLRQRAAALTGILNGADYGIWDPAVDRHLPRCFSRADISGKRVCKAVAQEELGLAVAPEVPLIAYLSRIAHQKMADTAVDALPALMDEDVQFALVGEGDRVIELALRALADRYPGRVAVRIGYEEPIAHRLQAGADMLLHPSRFEPCGLAPMYAMRYGALPIVRHAGGQVDVITDARADTIARGTATGFVFLGETTADMRVCLDRAIALYRQPLAWRKIQLEAMRQDFGWQRPAEQYLELYRSLTGTVAAADRGAGLVAEVAGLLA